MNIDDFFTTLYESSWRSNMKHEALSKMDKILVYLQEHREELADKLVGSIQDMESLKLEQKEEFTYTAFKKWLDYYAQEIITKELENV